MEVKMRIPKPIIIILFLCSMFFSNRLVFGQNPDTTNYFPHHLGDIWEYNYYDYIGSFSNILQTIIVFDSTDSIGNGYLRLDKYYINPYQNRGYSHFFIDTCGDVYETTSFYQNIRKIFKNDNQPGEWWIMLDTLGILEIAKCKSEYSYNLYGIQTTIRNIWYYYATDTTDTTTWFHIWSEEYAGGFGRVWKGGGETFSDLFIKGCSIDGVLYGDTTFTTLIESENKYQIPLNVKLNQNYPNPFNSETTFQFYTKNTSSVTLQVFDIKGKIVFKRNIDNVKTGLNQYKWKANSSLSSGIYFYSVKQGQNLSNIQKAIYLK